VSNAAAPRHQLLPAQAASPHHSRRYVRGAGGCTFVFLTRVQNAMLRPPTVMSVCAGTSGVDLWAANRRTRSILGSFNSDDGEWRPLVRGSNFIHAREPRNRRSAADHPMAARNHGSRRMARAQGHTNRDRVPWQTTPSKHRCTPGTQRAVWSR